MAKKKQIRMKTQAELESPEFEQRCHQQREVLTRSYKTACRRMSRKRHDFILDIASERWVNRFEEFDDPDATRREEKKWHRLRSKFLLETANPIELHSFSIHWNFDFGIAPIHQLVKNKHCDAGTALRLYWVNDPYYYQGYRNIKNCPDGEEREMLQILRVIERRFTRNEFLTRRFPFDPTPWIDDDTPNRKRHDMPPAMHIPIAARKNADNKAMNRSQLHTLCRDDLTRLTN